MQNTLLSTTTKTSYRPELSGRILQACIICGGVFTPKSSTVKRGDGRFCSRFCLGKSRTGDKNPHYQGGRIQLTCPICDATFTVNAYRLRQVQIICCSGSCAARRRAQIGQHYYKHGLSATPEYDRARVARRRANKKAAGGKFTAQQIETLKRRQHYRCAYCPAKLKDGYHIDHIVPLTPQAGERRGSNTIRNIQLLCPPCNLKKKNLPPEKFARKLGLLL